MLIPPRCGNKLVKHQPVRSLPSHEILPNKAAQGRYYYFTPQQHPNVAHTDGEPAQGSLDRYSMSPDPASSKATWDVPDLLHHLEYPLASPLLFSFLGKLLLRAQRQLQKLAWDSRTENHVSSRNWAVSHQCPWGPAWAWHQAATQ